MDIDLAALRAIERDKDISMDYLIKTLEDALLNAYQKTDNPLRGVKVEIDRKTGRVAVLAPEFDDDDNVIGYYDDTPDDFGRVAASTARQVIFQRIREAEDDQKYGHFSGTEGDILTGVIQADRDSRAVRVDLGSLEAIMPLAEQVPGEDYSHGKRLKVYVVSVRRELRGPQVVVSRTHPNLVRKLFALEVPEIAQGVVEIKEVAREAGHRQDRGRQQESRRLRQGSVHWSHGATGPGGHQRTQRRENRHRRLVGGSQTVRRSGSITCEGALGHSGR